MTSSPQGEGSGGMGKEEGSGEERKEGNDQPHDFISCLLAPCLLSPLQRSEGLLKMQQEGFRLDSK